MNRREFLDILRDYLKNDFQEDEVNDIIRDYEEYFVDGQIEGKSDLVIISALGSPKSIAMDLIGENKFNDKDMNNTNKYKVEELYNKVKIKVKKSISKGKEFFNEKLTAKLDGKSKSSNRLIKLALSLLSLVLIFPAVVSIGFMVCVAGILGLSIIGFVISIPLLISILGTVPQVVSLFAFMSLGFIGFQILVWQIFLFVSRYMKKVYKRYMNWLKTKNIYIKASSKMEEKNLDENRGGRR